MVVVLPTPDTLWQNAGMGYPPTLIEDLPIEAFRTVMDVNVTSAVICTREAFKVFKAQTPPGGWFLTRACGSSDLKDI